MARTIKERGRIFRRHPAFWAAVLAAGFLIVSAAVSRADDPKLAAAPQKAAAPAPPAVIPFAEIATRSMEVSSLLATITANAAPGTEVETIRKSLPDMRGQIDREVVRTISILQNQPTLAALQAEQQQWQRIQQQTAGWLNTLTQQATLLQDALNKLADLRKIWTGTRAAAQASKQPGPVQQQINATLAAIDAAQAPLQAQRTALLDLQSSVAHEVERGEKARAQINRAEQIAVEGILARDTKPLWSTENWAEATVNLPARMGKLYATLLAELNQYVNDPSCGMPLNLGLFIVLAVLFRVAQRQVRAWRAANEPLPQALYVFESPYACALVAPVFIVTAAFSQVPPMVQVLYQLLGIVTVIMLLRPVVSPRLLPLVYLPGMLFGLDAVRQTFVIAPLIQQVVLLLEIAGAIGTAAVLLRTVPPAGEAAVLLRLRLMRLAAQLALFILPVGFAAGLAGFMRLAGLITTGSIAASGLVLALYATVKVLTGVAAWLLRAWPLRLLRLVAHHRELLEQRVSRVLAGLAVVAFFVRLLNDVGLLNAALALVNSVFGAKLERGSISISIGDVLAFVLTVCIASLLSSFIRFVLQEDVYPRMRIAAGMSYALSSLTHYIIIALGVVVGMGVMGVNLNRVSVLAGAFGVGIGFGLQSVVNNFISGLILLFERPVHVGDTIEIGDLQGEVRRIGIRASIVRTWRGSDIIVPNAQFITEKVVNWTFRDQLRRIDLPVGVNYGAEPKKVIELLENMARANSRVLKDPPPQGLFIGYGDSTINFELRAWTDHYKDWQIIRSELAVAIYDAVYAAGMTFSFPQRDVRIIQEAKPEKKE